MTDFNLLPRPRELAPGAGSFLMMEGRRIAFDGVQPSARLVAAARRFQEALREHAGVEWEIAASAAGPAEEIGVALRLAPERVEHEQGYELLIAPAQVTVTARAEVGLYYGLCTLGQLVDQFGRELPAVEIRDWPDFAARGIMLDVSRDKVPRMETLRDLIDMLAGWKLNELQLYTEHTFAYRNHPDVWADASPFTGEEILLLDAYCRERYIDLVPNQNSFGHMHRWLKHPRYAHLAEVTDGFDTPWGRMDGPFSLAPVEPGSIELVRSLFDELLPHFSSGMFNVGCDETFDLGQGRSRALCEQRGVGRVYLDFLQQIYTEVTARGRTMQFWGDIIVEHPELIDELPKDSIALEWGYEADHPFAEHCPRFGASGIPFYVCPGTSAWCSIAGRTENALANLRAAAENGLRHGAIGYLITDWGDRGHWQTLPVSYLGFAAGLAYAWAWEANREIDAAAAVSAHAFRDWTGAMGRVAYELGNVYHGPLAVPNGSLLFWTLQLSFDKLLSFADRRGPGSPENLQEAFADALPAIDRAIAPLADARMDGPDAPLIKRELELTARLLRHAARRGLLAAEDPSIDLSATRRELADDMRQIIHAYGDIWLQRNRLGGLRDSVARLEQATADYTVQETS